MVKYKGSMSLPPLVNFPLSDALPIGASPSPEAVKRLTAGMQKDGVVEGMIADLLANHDVVKHNWILASGGGNNKVKGRTRKAWLREFHKEWRKDKKMMELGFLYVAFQIFTPGGDLGEEKVPGIKLPKKLDRLDIPYGFIWDDPEGKLVPTDPDDLFSI